jgi:hypothetical protein
MRCATCGFGLEAQTRAHGKHRAMFYGCSGYHRRGRTVCRNSLMVPGEVAHAEIITALERYLLNPKVLDAAVHRVADRICGRRNDSTLVALRRDLLTVERELANLTNAVAKGGDLPALVRALRQREADKYALTNEIAQMSSMVELDPLQVLVELQARLRDWRELLYGDTPKARGLLKQLIVDRVQMIADPEARMYRFAGRGTLVPLFEGVMPISVLELSGDGSAGRPPQGLHSVVRPQRDSNPCFGLERATS